MPLQMFKLKPGEGMRYRVALPNGNSGSDFFLIASRPDEGISVELELQLSGPNDVEIASGRVQLSQGYLAVINEVERQLALAVGTGGDGRVWFELHAARDSGELEGPL